jgi:EAL domain-containing protein (putative c-di-GMP-specific phosphodiesterase class I)/PAS domain-containing protein
MGSIKMRNPLLSKKLKQTQTRLLIIDDNQIGFNHIIDLLSSHEYQVDGMLLDDLKSFEKQLQQPWDLVIFGRAYDLKLEQALSLIHASKQHCLPVLLLRPDHYQAQQYSSYLHKGVYDVVSLDEPDHFFLGLVRALSFSRLYQKQSQLVNELETAQNHAQALVEESNRPVAIIQEGIHMQANAEYLTLFGFQDADDIIGLPLLDVLQPQETSEFKSRFKKISQGQLDLGRFSIQSANPAIGSTSPLSLEFLRAPEHDDALQLSIDQGEHIFALSSIPSKAEAPIVTKTVLAYQHVNRCLQQQPAIFNALVLFSLAAVPVEVLQHAWHAPKDYFSSMKEFLKEQTYAPTFELDPTVYISVFQAESKEKLESKLIGLTSLLKPQLLAVGQHSYPLNLSIGYRMIEREFEDQAHLEQIMSDAFAQPLPSNSREDALELNLEHTNEEDELSLLETLQQHLNNGQIHLKYQQIYDKQDTDVYIYEVTSGFIYQNRWISLENLKDLDEDPELSIKLDRWILVEACKQLHNFITQYPKAKLLVNLNKHVLLEDSTFPELITKLLSIVDSQEKQPLWLQFSERDLSAHFAEAQKQTALLHEHGAAISARDFGYSMYSESILKQIEFSTVTLDSDLTLALHNEAQTLELQQRLQEFYEIKNIDILLRGLDDMTLFANSWNLDARFIQGDYFQKKLDHLIAVDD